MIVVVTGLPAAGKTTVARGLANALGLPLFSLDAMKEALYDAPGGAERPPVKLRLAAEAVLAALLADSPYGSVVDIWLDPTRPDRDRLRAVLAPDAKVCEIFCDVTAETARRRYTQRVRHELHRRADPALLTRIAGAAELMKAGAPGAPSRLGPLLRLDTSAEFDVADLAAWVRLLAGEGD